MVRHYFNYLHSYALAVTTIVTTIPDHNIRILDPPPCSLNHSPDLSCAGAQMIMFLGRFLVKSTHLLPGRPRPARIRLSIDLSRNRCPDPENQDILDNSL